MRPQHFPHRVADGASAQMYCFDMSWPVHGRIASSRVEIYAAGALGTKAPLTVVLGDTPGSLPPICAHIEAICALVWHFYLVDLRLQSEPVRWIQRLPAGECEIDQWAEITFRGKPGLFVDPQWSETRPIKLLWDDVLAERCWIEEVRLINPQDISNADLYFTPDGCYKELTGACSLDDPMPSALGSEQSTWRYCRQLARMAKLWRLIVEYVGPERCMAELDVRALTVDRTVYDYVEQNLVQRLRGCAGNHAHGHRGSRELVRASAEATYRHFRRYSLRARRREASSMRGATYECAGVRNDRRRSHETAQITTSNALASMIARCSGDDRTGLQNPPLPRRRHSCICAFLV